MKKKTSRVASAKYRYKICVSGSSGDLSVCPPRAIALARAVGRAVVRQGGVMVTGATDGIPHYAAKAARDAGGLSIGFSPAPSEQSHVKTYQLPVDAFDVIVYTGFDYSGRNLLLTRAADAVIIICGRMGTLNEFTIAFEDRKPLGVLLGSGGTADRVREFVAASGRPWKWRRLVFDSDPEKLVAKVIRLINKAKGDRLQLAKREITHYYGKDKKARR